MGCAYCVCLQFAVGTDIKQTARRVVRASTECVAVREELDGVDVGVVGGKCLDTLLLTDVPQLSESIASTRDELVVVERVYAQAHDIAQVVCEFVHLGAGFQVPEHTGHVARGCEDALIADEAAAGQVARVARQFPSDASGSFPRGQVVDGTDVVQATAGDVVS